jgi:CTP:molybdopterin cytidylyltransferase MocA
MAGGSKLLCECGGSTVIRRVVSTAVSAGLDPIVVTVGDGAEAVRSALEGLVVDFAAVPAAPEGRLVSVVTGLEALRASCSEGVIILLGDEPGMTVEHVRAVWEGASRATPIAARASFQDRPGHPVFLPASVARSIKDLAGKHAPEASLWGVLVEAGLPHRHVPIEGISPIDIDTRADLARANERGFDS